MNKSIKTLAILGIMLNLSGCTRMVPASKEEYDVYVGSELSNLSGIYKVDENVRVILLEGYSVENLDKGCRETLRFGRGCLCNKGMYYLNLKDQVLYTLTAVKKIRFEDDGRMLKINRSSIENFNVLQTADHIRKSLKIKNDEISFIPTTDFLSKKPCHYSVKTEGKEIILRKRKVSLNK